MQSVVAIDAFHSASDDDKGISVGLMDTGQAVDYPDVFYDSTSNLFPPLEDSELFNGMNLLADGESQVDDWNANGETEPATVQLLSQAGISELFNGVDLLADGQLQLDVWNANTETLQLLSQAGIQQPAERQIRLHSELAHHLFTSADDSMLTRHDSMPVKTSSESELVRVLTSAVEDSSWVTPLLPRCDKFDVDSLQQLPAASMPSAEWLADIAATNSELVRQLTLSTDDVHVAGAVPNSSRNHYHHHHHHQQQQQQQHTQRVAFVQPTVARPSLKIDASQLIVDQEPQMAVSNGTELAASIERRQSSLSVHGVTVPVQSAVAAETTAPVQRHIVITTQAPVQAQQVQHISLQQLQQVCYTFIHLYILITGWPPSPRKTRKLKEFEND